MHFGASQNQTTLHTGVFYYIYNCTGFCTISDYNKHGSSAIWTHLKPILSLPQSKYSDIDTVYFVSDESTTQCRCKGNFYLLRSLFFDWGFKVANWSFLETSHGKGPADGIGGSVKRAADVFVWKGDSITNANSMKTALEQKKEASVRFFSISQVDVENVAIRPGPRPADHVTASDIIYTSYACIDVKLIRYWIQMWCVNHIRYSFSIAGLFREETPVLSYNS